MKTTTLLSILLLIGTWTSGLFYQNPSNTPRRSDGMVSRRNTLRDVSLDPFIAHVQSPTAMIRPNYQQLLDLVRLLPAIYRIQPRFDTKRQLVTYELYDKRVPQWLTASSISTHFIKPLAKTNLRTYTASSQQMKEAISKVFECDGQGQVGLFVSMSVNPAYRGKGLGDFLLTWGQFKCKELGCDYMLLVHDDKGSGKLVRYYEERGFRDISFFLDKAMICAL